MSWGAYISLFLVSTVKFMFAPMIGPSTGITFFETLLSCAIGALVSSSVFFFSARFFMDRAAKTYQKKLEESKRTGKPFKKKKKFTRVNKAIIKIKDTIGIIGICFWAPFFLSIPLGSIIVAKFYGDSKLAFPLIVLGILLNGTIVSTLAYFVF